MSVSKSKNRLGRALRGYMAIHDMTMRELGAEIGVSATTVLRLCEGREPDASTFLLVMRWLMRPYEDSK